MAEYESTLCWECQNTNRFKCSWFNPANPQPVPGWVAEYRPLRPSHTPDDGPVESYLVRECPNFVPEPEREVQTPPPQVYIPGVQLKKTKSGGGVWIARIMRESKNYYLGSFDTMEKARAARLAAEQAIARGEEPQAVRVPPRKVRKRREYKRKEYPPGHHPGVTRRKNRWYSHIKRNGKDYYLGCFKTEGEAIAARKAAEEAIARGEEPRRIT